MIDPVVVIPVYNHPATISRMVDAVLALGLPCLIVDDGSEPGCAEILDRLAREHADGLRLIRLPANQGKGAAMVAGLREARRQGYSHGLQIDADGQHETADISRFLAVARERPNAVICGYPVFDASVPRSRLYARYATHIWVCINTLSLAIRDSMCGFRVYPLRSTVALFGSVALGRRMAFDCEVLVRLYWRGVEIVNLPTPVVYPRDGVSHFRIWLDNLLIARMHATLFVGMLLRAPALLWRKASA